MTAKSSGFSAQGPDLKDCASANAIEADAGQTEPADGVQAVDAELPAFLAEDDAAKTDEATGTQHPVAAE